MRIFIHRNNMWAAGSPVGRRGSLVGSICGTGELVLSVEWKRQRDIKWWMVWWWWQIMNEVDGMKQEDYSKDWVLHNGKSDLWFWEKKMMVDEWWWWEMTNECGQEAEQRSGYGDMQVERWRESCTTTMISMTCDMLNKFIILQKKWTPLQFSVCGRTVSNSQ